jgi:hypothetical protein
MKNKSERDVPSLSVVCGLFCLFLTTILIAGCAAVTSTWANPKQNPDDPLGPGHWDRSTKPPTWISSPAYESRAGLAYFLPEGKIHIHAVRTPILITNYGMTFINFTNADGTVIMLTNSVSINEYTTNSTTTTNVTLEFKNPPSPAMLVYANSTSGSNNVIGPTGSNVALKLTAQVTISNIVTNGTVTFNLASNSLATVTTSTNQTIAVTNGTTQALPSYSKVIVSSYTKVINTQPFVTTNFFYNVTVSVDYQADPDRLFLLRPQLNWLRDDSPSVTIDGNGLLSTVNASNYDQSANIAVALGETAVQSFMLAGGIPVSTGGPNVGALRDYGAMEAYFDGYTKDESDELFRRRLEQAVTNLPESLAFPQTIDVSYDPFDASDFIRATNELHQGGLTILNNPRFSKDNADKSWKNWTNGVQKETSGVFYRPVIPYTVSIRDLTFNQVAATVLLPNKAPILNLPLDTAPFVSVISQVTFTNGLIGSYSVSKPSSFMALAECPLIIISDITSSVTNLLQLRINLGNGQAALQNTQYSNQAAANTAYIAQQNALLTALSNKMEIFTTKQNLYNLTNGQAVPTP